MSRYIPLGKLPVKLPTEPTYVDLPDGRRAFFPGASVEGESQFSVRYPYWCHTMPATVPLTNEEIAEVLKAREAE